MDETVVRTVGAHLHPGERAAAQLSSDHERLAVARRLLPQDGDSHTLDRLAALAARLLGAAASQISLLTDVQLVAAGGNLPAGMVGASAPSATRCARLPPPAAERSPSAMPATTRGYGTCHRSGPGRSARTSAFP